MTVLPGSESQDFLRLSGGVASGLGKILSLTKDSRETHIYCFGVCLRMRFQSCALTREPSDAFGDVPLSH